MYSRRQLIRTSLATGASICLGSALASCRNASSDVLTDVSMQAAWINDAEFMGYFVGLTKGFYKQEGLDFKYLPGGPEIVADTVVISGRSDIALTTPDATLRAISEGRADLKIIGAQYQKSPLGIVSLEKNHITSSKDLIGKRVAVPPANVITMEAFLRINSIEKSQVEIVPYQYDPGPLLRGEVDATLDFVTNVPFTIREKGGSPTSFLLYDFGFQIFNDTVVVQTKILNERRPELVRWLRASRKGWEENFRNPEGYARGFSDTWFAGTGRSIDNEIYFNKAQRPLIESPKGIFSLGDDSVQACIDSLKQIGVAARKDMFDTTILSEI